MTIPEPDNDTLMLDLEVLYRHIHDRLQLEPTGVRELISRAYHAELERDTLLAKIHDSDRIGTHYDGCWDSGHRHYACAVAEITQLRARVAELENLVEDVLINKRNGLLLPIELAGGTCEWHARRSSLMELEAKGVAGE